METKPETRKGLTFLGLRNLAAWLKSNPTGRDFFERLIAEEVDQRCRAKELVVVVVEADGMVEVYGSAGVNVAVRTLLDGGDETRTDREAYMVSTLPMGFRKLYRLKCHKGIARCKSVSAEEELRQLSRTEELRILKAWKPVFDALRKAQKEAADDIPEV